MTKVPCGSRVSAWETYLGRKLVIFSCFSARISLIRSRSYFKSSTRLFCLKNMRTMSPFSSSFQKTTCHHGANQKYREILKKKKRKENRKVKKKSGMEHSI